MLRRLVILGTGRMALAAARFAARIGAECLVVMGTRQKAAVSPQGEAYVSALQAEGARVEAVSKLVEAVGNPHVLAGEGSWLFSFGSPFIIRQDLLALYPGRAFNMHNTPLPAWRGGASYSWMIMTGCRGGATTIHEINEGIDTGRIAYQEKYRFPEQCRFPGDYADHAVRQAESALLAFLERIRVGRPVELVAQDEAAATYFPRLNTDSHAFIDWSWSGGEIERFICAFSRPHAGAMSFVNGQMVRILDARWQAGHASHAFMAGLITRRHDGMLTVMCRDGVLAIRLSDLTSDSAIAVGDRMVTPPEKLEQALQMRAVYTASGLKGG